MNAHRRPAARTRRATGASKAAPAKAPKTPKAAPEKSAPAKRTPAPAANTASASATSASGLTPPLRVLLGLAAAVIVLVGMSLGRELIGPLAVAAVIVIVCNPVRRPLERWGWPSWLATTAVVLLSYAVLIVMALLLAYAAAQFTALAFDYYGQLRDSVLALVKTLHDLGLDSEISAAATSMLTPSKIVGLATQLGSGTLSVLTVLFFILAYAVFMSADAARFGRAEQSFGPSARPAVRRFAAFNTGVRRYYVVNAAFGLIVAIIDGLALWWLGIPAPVVWAVLAFVTNFVPNIGFVLGLLPPMLLGLVVGGWPMMLAVIAIYSVVNVVLQVFVQPKFVSDAVNLSLTLSFLSVLFWTFIIGPLGAILSIPLTLLVRALVLESDSRMRWLRWLSGDDAAVEGSRTPGS